MQYIKILFLASLFALSFITNLLSLSFIQDKLYGPFIFIAFITLFAFNFSIYSLFDKFIEELE